MTARMGWIVFGFTMLLTTVAMTLSQLQGEGFLRDSESIAGVAFITFGLVGAIVLTRHRRHLLGSLFVITGLTTAIASATDQYARYAVTNDLDLPGVVAAAWVQNWIWFSPVGLAFTFCVLLFPDGHLPSKRWAPVAWGAGIGLVGFAAGIALMKGPLDGYPTIPNPTGMLEEGPLTLVFFLLIVLSAIGSAVSMFFRYRRAGATERLQLKYVVFGVATALTLVLAMPYIPINVTEAAEDLLFGAIMCIFPITCGISILKHNLYEIDVIINRALVYAVLTAVLAGAYLGIVFALQQFLPVGSESDVAVAASTLAVAGLFRPLRSRVQGFIDRRFFRRKYDAGATLADFSARLRSEVALEDVQRDVIDTLATTMQPVHASLWLREVSGA